MPIPLAAWLPAAIGAVGAMIGRKQSQGDIARQNAYNSPAQQVKRLREAGLPIAAMEGGYAGEQSQLPETSGREIGGNIASYITTQTQLQQLKILEEEWRLKRTEAERNEAETTWLLSQRGTDTQGTNMTQSLGFKQDLEGAQAKGQQFASEILGHQAANTPYRLNQENVKIDQEIASIITNRKLADEHITGAQLENKIQAVKAQYQSKMSQAEFVNLLRQNELLNKNIEGKDIQNDIDAIRRTFESETVGTRITQMHTNELMQKLNYDSVKQHFADYNQYAEFLRITRDNFLGKDGYHPIKFLEAIVAMAYTTATGLTGQAPQLGNLMQGMYQHYHGN